MILVLYIAACNIPEFHYEFRHLFLSVLFSFSAFNGGGALVGSGDIGIWGGGALREGCPCWEGVRGISGRGEGSQAGRGARGE